MSESGKRKKQVIKNSIIVPVYNEEGNVRILVEELMKEFFDVPGGTEIIFVNDNSTDGTLKELTKLVNEGYNVNIQTRTNKKGLSSAVIHGFKAASGEKFLCMDGDLQHPPKTAAKMMKKLGDGTNFVIATRYYPGTDIYRSWSRSRILVSKVAQALAHLISNTSDPMSGFFAISKSCFERALKNGINSEGFKIGLELLVKAEVKKCELKEIEYKFGKRAYGQSKLTPAVIIYYLKDLFFLYLWVIRKMVGAI